MNQERNDKILKEATERFVSSVVQALKEGRIGAIELRLNINKGGITNYNKTEYSTFTQ
jgi:hypothetical protein